MGEVAPPTRPTTNARRLETADTPPNEKQQPLAGASCFTRFHDRPFQCISSDSPGPQPQGVIDPTAQTLRGELALTAFNLPSKFVGSLGSRTRFQTRPFQCSATGAREPPTAHALWADRTATAASASTAGVATTTQAEPFQCRITDFLCAVEPVSFPTAQASLRERAATPPNVALNGRAGTACRVHAEPSQCRINGLL